MTKLPKYIMLKIEDQEKTVLTTDYVTAKTKQLREFGYTDLDAETVKEQLAKVLADEEVNIIGTFMKDEAFYWS